MAMANENKTMSAFDRLSRAHTFASSARKTDKVPMTPAPIKTTPTEEIFGARTIVDQRPIITPQIIRIKSATKTETKPIFSNINKSSIKRAYAARNIESDRPSFSQSHRRNPKRRDETALARKSEKKSSTKPNGRRSKNTHTKPSRKYHFRSPVDNNIISPKSSISQLIPSSQDAESQSLSTIDTSDSSISTIPVTSSIVKDNNNECKEVRDNFFFELNAAEEIPSQDHHDDQSISSSTPAQESELMPPQQGYSTSKPHSPSAFDINGDDNGNAAQEGREDDELKDILNDDDNYRDIDTDSKKESRPTLPINTEEAARVAAEEEAMAKAAAEEAERIRVVQEARRKAEEEETARLQAEEEVRIAAAVETERKRIKEDARIKAEEEEAARLQAEEEARVAAAILKAAAAESARIKAEEAVVKAQEEEIARIQAEEEARLAAEEEAKTIAAALERKKIEEELRRKAEEETSRLRAEEEKAKVRADNRVISSLPQINDHEWMSEADSNGDGNDNFAYPLPTTTHKSSPYQEQDDEESEMTKSNNNDSNNGNEDEQNLDMATLAKNPGQEIYSSLLVDDTVRPDSSTSQQIPSSQDAESILPKQVSSTSESQFDSSGTINSSAFPINPTDNNIESNETHKQTLDLTTSGETPSQEYRSPSPLNNNHDDQSISSSPPVQESELMPPQEASSTSEPQSPSVVDINGDGNGNSAQEERDDDESELTNSNNNDRDIDIESKNESKEAHGRNLDPTAACENFGQEFRPPSSVENDGISSLLQAQGSALMSLKPVSIASDQSPSEADNNGHSAVSLPLQPSTQQERNEGDSQAINLNINNINNKCKEADEKNLDLIASGKYPSQESSPAISLSPPAQDSDSVSLSQVSSTSVSHSPYTIESNGERNSADPPPLQPFPQQDQKIEEYGVTNSCCSKNETKESHEYSPDVSIFREKNKNRFRSSSRLNIYSSHYRPISSPSAKIAKRSKTASSLNSIKSILKKQQERTILLVHAANCTDDHCATAQCVATRILWKHMKTCSDEDCEVIQCVSSRSILSHYHSCSNTMCLICSPARNSNTNKLGNIKGDSMQCGTCT